jgi:hypothetical protein
MKLGQVSLVFAAVLAACTTTSPSVAPVAGRPVLGIANGTNLTVKLFVNGESVGESRPGVGLPPIDFNNLPALPWTVEARSPSGRVLTSMRVEPGVVAMSTDPAGNLGTSGTIGRVDLSCGRVTIWAGYFAPSGPPPPSPAGSPGDCTP